MIPLHWAAQHGHLSLVEYLVNQQVDINAKDNKGMTPLHWSAYNGHLSVVEYLVNKKADINAKNNHGKTPLRMVPKNRLKVLEYFRSKGGQ